jgi:hypothetical protein
LKERKEEKLCARGGGACALKYPDLQRTTTLTEQQARQEGRIGIIKQREHKQNTQNNTCQKHLAKHQHKPNTPKINFQFASKD